MADNTNDILIQIKIEENRALRKLKDVKEGVVNLDRRTKKYKETVVEQVRLESQLTSLRKQRIAVNKQAERSVEKLTKSTRNQKNATGAASSSAMELSRVISDAPYGIRGMANNITQLVSQLGYQASATNLATGAAYGYGGALKAMWKSLMGPLGVVFAITLAVSALDFFTGGQKKAKKVTSEFNDLVNKQAGKLMILDSIIKDSSVSLSDKKKIISDVNEEFEDLNITIDNQGQLTKTSQKNIDKLTESLVKNAKAQAVLGKITKEQSKIVEIEIERAKRIAEGGVGAFKGTLEDLEKQRQKYIKRNSIQISNSNLSEEAKAKATSDYLKGDAMRRFDALSSYRSKDVQDAKDNINELQKIITGESLFSIFTKKTKGKRKPLIKLLPDPKEFDKELNDYLSELSKLNEKAALLGEKSELAKIEVQKKAHIERLKAKNKEEVELFKLKAESYEREYRMFLEHQVRMGEMTQPEADQALMELVESTDKKIAINKTGFDKILSAWLDFYDKKAKLAEKADGDKKREEEVKKLEEFAEKVKEITKLITDFFSGEMDRQITIEKNKTNALNEELNNRLLNENLSKDERASIQNEIAQNDERLRKKQEAIERKRFMMTKAANIATAILDTYVAANKAIAIYGPTPAGFGAMAASITAGLINVATIARTKFQSSSAKTPINTGSGGGSGGSGGVGDRDFNFNLVGNTQGNQLAEAIQGQFSQPLQAFVVSHDITTQQELDAEIQGSATF